MPGPQLLPPQYRDLAALTAPNLVVVALRDYGLQEYPGGADNPTIMQWARDLGVQNEYIHDSIAWCGLGMGHFCQAADKPVVPGLLWALNWAKWEMPADRPSLGDILTFQRDGGGHVALYVGEDEVCFHILGCNQSDSVCITRIAKNRLYAARRPRWKIAQPPEVRPIFRAPTGQMSRNEA